MRLIKIKMSKKLKILESKLSLFKITGKASMSTSSIKNIVQTFYIVATSKQNATYGLYEENNGSDEIFIESIDKIGNFEKHLSTFIFSNRSLQIIKKECNKIK
jgi:hypothetical protein